MTIQVAKRVELGLCPNPKCRSIHVFLCNEENKPFAMGAVKPEETEWFIKTIKDLAYEAAATRETK